MGIPFRIMIDFERLWNWFSVMLMDYFSWFMVVVFYVSVYAIVMERN